MRKLFLVLIATLLMAGVAYAGTTDSPAYEGSIWVGGHNQPGTAIQEYILVRYPGNDSDAVTSGISSGDACVWTASADGVSVSIASLDSDVPGGKPNFAGVAVCSINSGDNYGVVDTADDNWGYICIRGYCLAYIDVSESQAMGALKLNSDTAKGGAMATLDGENYGISQDIGTLLEVNTAGDGLNPVWLR